MRYGIVSDIHANIQAWKAVLRDMRNEGVDSILCLGDVVGYGPNPAEVLDSCYQHVDYFILGNHDAVIGNRLDSNLFNDNAKFLIEWTRDQLNQEASNFFSDLPLRMEGDGFACAHAELALPGRFSYIYEAQDAIESFTSNQSPVMFVGHTHFPAKFRYDLSTNLVFEDPCEDSYLNENERYLINVGSVGDPRDGQTTASYCIYDADQNFLTYRQVPFDIKRFRLNLDKAKLPIQPYFLSVYEGEAQERETIKDMKVMESNQAAEADENVQKIHRGTDTKTARQKITFSMDDVRSNRKSKEEKARKRKSDSESKKKGVKIISVLLVLLLITFGGVYAWLKLKENEQKPQDIVNKVPEKLKQEMKKTVVIQSADEDMLLNLDAVKKTESLTVQNGSLNNWKEETDKISWEVRIKNKGWYKVFIDHQKASGESQIEIKFGPHAVAGQLKESKGEQELALIENVNTGQMNFSLSLAESSDKEVTKLRGVRLQYLGEEKPFNYASEDRLLGDFEKGDFSGWISTIGAFGHKPLSAETLPAGVKIENIQGNYVASSAANGANVKGILRTPEFLVEHKLLCMIAAGGKECSVNLYVDEQLEETHKFTKMSPLKKLFFNLKPHAGKKAYLEFIDNGKEFIAFDNVLLTIREPGEYNPKDLKTITGKKDEAAVNELNKYLSKVGTKLIKKDFKGALRDLEEAAVVTETNLDEFTREINKISNLEELVIATFEKDLKKVTTIKAKGTGRDTSIFVDSIKGDKVIVRVGESQTLTPLGILNLSEDGIKERLALFDAGILAYHIHNEDIEDKISSIRYKPKTPIAILVNAALGGLKVNYPKNAIVGSQIEIWAMEGSPRPSWDLAVKTNDGDTVYEKAEIKDITEVYPAYKTKGLTKKPFKVYCYDLATEKHIKEISFKNTKGTLKTMMVILRNTQNRIVWQKGYNENTSTKDNLLRPEPIRFYMKNGEPDFDNLAQGKPYTASDPHSGGYEGVNDGIWGATPPFVFASSRKDNFPKYVSIDLEEEIMINALRFGIPNRGSTKSISLQYSLDNNEFINIVDFTFKQGQQDRFTAYFEAVKAKYIRVRFNENFEKTLNRAENTHVFLSELEAFYLD